MNGQPLPIVNVEKDLSAYVDNQLKFHHHTAAVIARANRILAIINKSFVDLDTSMLPMQNRVTRMVASIRHLPYTDRLKILKLPSLQYRRMRGDMILVYQLFHDLINIPVSLFFTPAPTGITRGHNFKIFKPHAGHLIRSDLFSNHIIDNWNSLPSQIVNASSANNFKELLDNY